MINTEGTPVEKKLSALSPEERLILSAIIHPESKDRLAKEEEEVLARYGFDVRYKLNVQTREGVQSFFTVPLAAEPNLENHSEMSGYVYCRPAQGRVSSIEGSDGLFHEIKGNGMSSLILRRTLHSVPWYNFGPYTTDGYDGYIGLLGHHEAMFVQSFLQKHSEFVSSKDVYIVNPTTLPDMNYNMQGIQALKRKDACLGLHKTFEPTFLYRSHLSPATLADCLVLPFGVSENPHAHWIAFLGDGIAHDKGRVSYMSDAQIISKLQLVQQNALPYKYSFLMNCSEATDLDFGVDVLRLNYQYMLQNDLSHGSLHVQNIRLFGELSDVNSFSLCPTLSTAHTKQRMHKDFISIYNALLLQSIIFRNDDLLMPEDFHEHCIQITPSRTALLNLNDTSNIALQHWLSNVKRVKALINCL